jgi:hypothetical protein
VRVLGIEVSAEHRRRWEGWFAPRVQPFVVDDATARSVGGGERELPPELRDTYEIYAVPEDRRLVWLDEAQLMALPRPQRCALVRRQLDEGRGLVPSVRAWAPLVGEAARDQADGRRFVWWPSLLVGIEDQALLQYVEDGRRASCHHEVEERTWAAAAEVVPGARRLAGTFPAASGPNCFGAVMASAGVPGAETVWMQREPFEEWLAARTRPGGDYDDPGTVLVWRSPDGFVQHAAVTLGGGWALHKPSQGWMSPTKVLPVAACVASSRAIGRRLERHRIVA